MVLAPENSKIMMCDLMAEPRSQIIASRQYRRGNSGMSNPLKLQTADPSISSNGSGKRQ